MSNFADLILACNSLQSLLVEKQSCFETFVHMSNKIHFEVLKNKGDKSEELECEARLCSVACMLLCLLQRMWLKYTEA